ncbi:MAG: TIM barrel protein, partial [Terriglobia bacterium]
PIHTAEGLKQVVNGIDSTIDLKNLFVIHANDSKVAFESHVDRHEHIGKGQIGAEAFARIVRHPKLKSIPFICETPVDKPGDDLRNIRMMRKLAKSSRQ